MFGHPQFGTFVHSDTRPPTVSEAVGLNLPREVPRGSCTHTSQIEPVAQTH